MPDLMRRLSGALAAACAPACRALGLAASKNFVPDHVFKGSTPDRAGAAGRRRLARAERRDHRHARDGGGWLIARALLPGRRVLRVVPLRGRAASAGVLLRAEKTPDGGLKGIFVVARRRTTSSPIASRSTRRARETSRERLRPAGGGQVRVAPPPPPRRRQRAGGARRGGGGAGGRGGGGLRSRLQMPGGIERADRAAGDAGLKAGEWNTIELVLDANILRAFLNDAGGVAAAWPTTSSGASAPFALYAGGTGEVRFKDVSFKDLPAESRAARGSLAPLPHADAERVLLLLGAVGRRHQQGRRRPTSSPARTTTSVPTTHVAREIYMAQTIDASTQYFNGVQYALRLHGRRLARRRSTSSSPGRPSSTSTRGASRAAGTRSP